MNSIKDLWDNFDSAAKKGICIGLVVVMLFSSGYLTGALTSVNGSTDIPVAQAPDTTVQSVQVDATTTTAAPQTTAPTTAAPETTVAPPADNAGDTQTTAAPSNGAPTSTEEIVALFNESAGKIKTTATKATRNYQDMKILKMEVPGALQTLADSAISKYVKPNLTPEVYEGTAAVKEKYPVSGTDFASKLKPEYVENITCTDNGTEYVIDIKMKDQLNPVYRSGEGVGSIFWTMNIDDIANNVPGLQKSELSYYNCSATAKIDKATGNMTYSKFDYTFDMNLEIKMLGTLTANGTINVVEEYTIEY